MRPTSRFTLIPQDTLLTIAARGSLTTADADRLAAVCVSLPEQTRALVLDLTSAGLIAAETLRRVSRAASSWRYARAATVTLRFRASRFDESGEPTAEDVPVEVRYPARTAAPRPRVAVVPRASRARSAFAVAPMRLALRTSA